MIMPPVVELVPAPAPVPVPVGVPAVPVPLGPKTDGLPPPPHPPTHEAPKMHKTTVALAPRYLIAISPSIVNAPRASLRRRVRR